VTVVLSPYLRCIQTVEPLAAARGVAIEPRDPSLPSSCETFVSTLLLSLRARLESSWDAGEGLNGAVGRPLERAVGERKRMADARAGGGVPDPELVERPFRRRFSAEYKLRVLREADACTKRGEIGALLRREGLYSSLLTEWRRAREVGALEALERPRGRRRA
jgi:transposase-like protein